MLPRYSRTGTREQDGMIEKLNTEKRRGRIEEKKQASAKVHAW